MLKVQGLHKSYSEKVLHDIKMEFGPGEIHVIMGKSGAGKSTLLKILAGLESVDQGNVSFEGRTLNNPDDVLVPGHEELAYVAQDFKLLPNRTVLENLKDALLAFKDEFAQTQIKMLLHLMKLGDLENKRVEKLSGGEKQRLAIARAMATQPAVLLLDESFTQLDFSTRQVLLDALFEVNKKLQTTIIFVSHNSYEAFYLAQKVHLLINGKILRSGSSQEVYLNPQYEEVAKLFGEFNTLKTIDLEEYALSQVMIWPEKLKICDAKQAKTFDLYLKGEYVSSQHLGQVTKSKVKLQSGNEISVVSTQNPPCHEGEKIEIGAMRSDFMNFVS